MLGEVIFTLCDIADKYKENGETEKLEATRVCLDVIHSVYRKQNEEMEYSDEEAKNKLHEIAMKNALIKFIRDKDGDRKYEIDGKFYYSAEEVLLYDVEIRNRIIRPEIEKVISRISEMIIDCVDMERIYHSIECSVRKNVAISTESKFAKNSDNDYDLPVLKEKAKKIDYRRIITGVVYDSIRNQLASRYDGIFDVVCAMKGV